MSYVKGIHPVSALLNDAPERVRVLLVQKNRRDTRMQNLIAAAKTRSVRCEFVEKRRLDRVGGDGHQGVVADCHALSLATEADLEDVYETWAAEKLFLVLESVSDPRNLGAALRTAAAAGVNAVLVPKRRSAPLNSAALKAAAGAAERLMIVEVVNLARRLEWFKQRGVWIVGATPEAERGWTEVDFCRDVVIVVGSEGEGLRVLTRKLCDETVTIPMAEAMDSLNVSVATGVLLFEVVRQRASPDGG